MTKPDSIAMSGGVASSPAMPASYVFQSCLSLVLELERNLTSSQTALLALDAAGTEKCMREQMRLHRALQVVLMNPSSPEALSPGEKCRNEFRHSSPEVADQLFAAAKRVQHLARVQAGLLRRSQQFLCVLANWMTGPEAIYGAPRAARSF